MGHATQWTFWNGTCACAWVGRLCFTILPAALAIVVCCVSSPDRLLRIVHAPFEWLGSHSVPQVVFRALPSALRPSACCSCRCRIFFSEKLVTVYHIHRPCCQCPERPAMQLCTTPHCRHVKHPQTARLRLPWLCEHCQSRFHSRRCIYLNPLYASDQTGATPNTALHAIA